MGGYLAYDGAMFESKYFAAIAVHAMRIADDYTWILSRAERKTPISIYIGDHDQFFKEEPLAAGSVPRNSRLDLISWRS